MICLSQSAHFSPSKIFQAFMLPTTEVCKSSRRAMLLTLKSEVGKSSRAAVLLTPKFEIGPKLQIIKRRTKETCMPPELCSSSWLSWLSWPLKSSPPSLSSTPCFLPWPFSLELFSWLQMAFSNPFLA